MPKELCSAFEIGGTSLLEGNLFFPLRASMFQSRYSNVSRRSVIISTFLWKRHSDMQKSPVIFTCTVHSRWVHPIDNPPSIINSLICSFGRVEMSWCRMGLWWIVYACQFLPKNHLFEVEISWPRVEPKCCIGIGIRWKGKKKFYWFLPAPQAVHCDFKPLSNVRKAFVNTSNA